MTNMLWPLTDALQNRQGHDEQRSVFESHSSSARANARWKELLVREEVVDLADCPLIIPAAHAHQGTRLKLYFGSGSADPLLHLGFREGNDQFRIDLRAQRGCA